MDSINNTLSN